MTKFFATETCSSMDKMAAGVLAELGLTFLEPEFSLLDGGYEIRMRLHCSRVESMRTFAASPRAAVDWLSDIFKGIQAQILDSPIFKRQVNILEQSHANLRDELERVTEEVEELRKFKAHYDLEMRLRHGAL